MAPYLKLFVVSCLLLCYTLCVPACAASAVKSEAKKSAVLFQAKEKLSKFRGLSGEKDLSASEITLEKIQLPLLVPAKDGLTVAVAEADHTGTLSKKKIELVAKYFGAGGDAWDKEGIEEIVKKWEVQLATDKGDKAKSFSKTRASVVNEDGSQIYIIFLGIDEETPDQPLSFKLVKGTVSDAPGETGGKKITWGTKKLDVTQKVTKAEKALKGVNLGSFAYDQFAFLNKERKVMCVVKSKSDKPGTKDVTAVFRLNDKETELELLFAEQTTDIRSIFEWEGEIYRTLTTDPSDGSKRVMVFDESTNDFTERDNSITRLGDFLKDKKNFATSKIGAEGSALLFTEERENGTGGKDKKDAHLWMSDGDRVGYVGSILSGFKKTSYGPVLYTNNNLFALYQNYTDEGEKQEDVFYLIRLDEQFKNVTNTLKAWKKSREDVDGLSGSTSAAKIHCPTTGLVGFLHKTINTGKTEWKDEYFYFNATVKSGNMLSTGLKFSGTGAGAIWPVKKAAKDQPYKFTDPGFTLVATVTVGSEKIIKDEPILGVVLEDGSHVGLWCTKGDKWGASKDKDKTAVTPSEESCNREASYRVVLVLKKKRVSIYVNEKELKDLDSALMGIEETKSIIHFYFGAYIDAQSTKNDDVTYVTVTNAFLYNRPLSPDEIQSLKEEPQEVRRPDNTHTHQGGDRNEQQVPREGVKETIRPPAVEPPTAQRNKEEKSAGEDGALRVRVGVFSLLFGLWTVLLFGLPVPCNW